MAFPVLPGGAAMRATSARRSRPPSVVRRVAGSRSTLLISPATAPAITCPGKPRGASAFSGRSPAPARLAGRRSPGSAPTRALPRFAPPWGRRSLRSREPRPTVGCGGRGRSDGQRLLDGAVGGVDPTGPVLGQETAAPSVAAPDPHQPRGGRLEHLLGFGPGMGEPVARSDHSCANGLPQSLRFCSVSATSKCRQHRVQRAQVKRCAGSWLGPFHSGGGPIGRELPSHRHRQLHQHRLLGRVEPGPGALPETVVHRRCSRRGDVLGRVTASWRTCSSPAARGGSSLSPPTPRPVRSSFRASPRPTSSPCGSWPRRPGGCSGRSADRPRGAGWSWHVAGGQAGAGRGGGRVPDAARRAGRPGRRAPRGLSFTGPGAALVCKPTPQARPDWPREPPGRAGLGGRRARERRSRVRRRRSWARVSFQPEAVDSSIWWLSEGTGVSALAIAARASTRAIAHGARIESRCAVPAPSAIFNGPSCWEVVQR